MPPSLRHGAPRPLKLKFFVICSYCGQGRRSWRYLNNVVEQDHRGVKSRIKPMLGFKVFDRAAVTIAGVELLHRIRKGQFNLRRLRIAGQAAPAIWSAVLSA